MTPFTPACVLAFALAARVFSQPATDNPDQSPPAAQATPELVGEFWSVKCLKFKGVQTFTEDNIRAALGMNPDFLLAAHPTAPFPAYLETVRGLVTAGYRNSGFLPRPRRYEQCAFFACAANDQPVL